MSLHDSRIKNRLHDCKKKFSLCDTCEVTLCETYLTYMPHSLPRNISYNIIFTECYNYGLSELSLDVVGEKL